eukprot:ctg_754.g447
MLPSGRTEGPGVQPLGRVRWNARRRIERSRPGEEREHPAHPDTHQVMRREASGAHGVYGGVKRERLRDVQVSINESGTSASFRQPHRPASAISCPVLPSHPRLQKVVRGATGDVRLTASRCRVELQKGVLLVLVQLHDGRLVAATITIVRRAEHRHHIAVVAPIVTLHDQLVGARNQRQAVGAVEQLRNVLPERVAGAARRYAPAAAVVGVGPQQITHRALVRHLLHPIQRPDLIQRVHRGRQAAVQTQNAVVDQRCQRHIVEHVGKILPHVGVAVLSQALIVKAVHLGDLARLVIAAQDGHSPRIPQLETDERGDRLHRVVAAVHVVAHEEVVGVRALAAYFEQLQQVVKLTVNVATHGHRAADRLYVGLAQKNLLGTLTQRLDVLLGQRPTVFRQQLGDPHIQIHTTTTTSSSSSTAAMSARCCTGHRRVREAVARRLARAQHHRLHRGVVGHAGGAGGVVEATGSDASGEDTHNPLGMRTVKTNTRLV